MPMFRKLNSSKTALLLVVAVILAVSVCFSAVYAWFYTNSFANATVSAKVLNFNFTANSTFNQDLSFTDETGNSLFVYTAKPDGMFPGQTATATLELSNTQSNLDARYKLTFNATDANFPEDTILTITDVTDEAKEVVYYKGCLGNLTDGDSVLPGSNDADNDGYIILATGKTQKFEIEFYWPYSYEDFPSHVNGNPFNSADEKNAADLEYYKDNTSKSFKVSFKLDAEQLATATTATENENP